MAEDQLAAPCPTCGAGVGLPCMSARGNPRRPHGHRRPTFKDGERVTITATGRPAVIWSVAPECSRAVEEQYWAHLLPSCDVALLTVNRESLEVVVTEMA